MDIFTESSGISDSMNSSGAEADLPSPESMMNMKPRKLTFSPMENTPHIPAHSPHQMCISPPYRKVRALRLFDSPQTPKTIIQKSSARNLNYLSTNNNAPIVSHQKPHIRSSILSATTNGQTNHITNPCGPDRPKPVPLHNRALANIQSANINPFTPNSLLSQNKKRCRTMFGQENALNASLPISLLNNNLNTSNSSIKGHIADDDDEVIETHQAPKRLALQDTNISRYEKEFLEISLIGVGEFGLVYQCLNRLDGCIYAIKKSIKPVAGSSFEKRALNEVWAHAVLGKHDNVVRYYSAWAEDNHMLIQNEYCNGGSLQSLLSKRCLSEAELRILLLHIAEGLRYIHSNDLVHMDLKSGNIFLTKVPSKNHQHTGNVDREMNGDDGFEDIYDELASTENIITYKIGDLGHVTSAKEANIEEGDCRYLPNEILQEDFRDLYKADIFSLGVTMFEAAGGGPLPKNGPEWHMLRNGQVPDIPSLSREFNDLIKLMTHPDPDKRPTSTSIFNHPVLCSLESKSKSQLTQELAIEKRKNDILMKKLKEAKKLIKIYEQQAHTSTGTRLSLKVDSSSDSIQTDRCLRSNTRKRRTSRISGGGGI